MFLGTYHVSVASGRRVFIPAPLRANLGQNLIIARWYEQCLVLISKDSWKALYKRITGGRDQIALGIRDTERFILGSAYEIKTDDQGRIIIPELLANYASIKDEVSFLGLGDRVEIWNRKIWTEKEKNIAKEATEYLEKLAKNEK